MVGGDSQGWELELGACQQDFIRSSEPRTLPPGQVALPGIPRGRRGFHRPRGVCKGSVVENKCLQKRVKSGGGTGTPPCGA